MGFPNSPIKEKEGTFLCSLVVTLLEEILPLLIKIHNDNITLYLLLLSCSVQVSHSVMSNSLRPHGLQHAKPPCPSPTPGVHSNTCALSRWCHPAISSSSPSPPAPNPSQHQGLFQWVSFLHEVAKVLEFQPQHQSFQWTPRTGLL